MLTQRISKAQVECHQLTAELQRVRQDYNDATLQSLSGHCRHLLSPPMSFRPCRCFTDHFDQVSAVAWLPDSRHLVSASQDGLLIAWDTVTGYKRSLIDLDDPWVTCCDASADGRLVGVGGLENACVVYKLGLEESQGALLSIFKGHQEYISGLRFMTGSSSQLVTCSGDKMTILWDVSKGGEVSKFYGHLGDVLALDVRPGNPRGFVTVSCDRMGLVWDTRIPMSVRKFPIDSGCDPSAVKFFPDGYSFAVGSDDSTIKLFDLRSDGKLADYDAFVGSSKVDSASESIQGSFDTPGVVSLDFSCSGRLMLVSYSDWPTVVVRDTLTGSILGRLEGHGGVVEDVRVSPDGVAVATASRDESVRIWTA